MFEVCNVVLLLTLQISFCGLAAIEPSIAHARTLKVIDSANADDGLSL